MIERPRVLRPDETPDQELIKRRGDALRDVREQCRRLRHGEANSPFVIHGPPGTGKTMVATHVLDRYYDDAPAAYVDCWEYYSEQNLLSEVARRLGVMAAKPDSTPTSRIVDALEEQPDDARLVVLDELELVHEPAALKILADAPEVSVIGIVNDPDEVGDVLSAAWGGLDRAQMLRFREYSRRAVKEIVGTRAEHGLLDGSLPQPQLRTIARRAEGDARLGIATLQAAARQCMYGGTIDSDDVAVGFERARRQLHQSHIDRLTDHQEAVYEILSEAGAEAPGEIYQTYQDRVDDPRSRTAVTRYLRKMCHYGLIESVGTTRDRRYRIDQSGYVAPESA